MKTILRQLLQFAFTGLLVLLLAGSAAQAQGPSVSNVCQTYYGVCYLQHPEPIGLTCYCGNDQGRIIYPQQNSPRQVPRRDPRLSDTCATAYGVCSVNWGPIGSGCYCGPDPGRRIER